VNRPGVGRTRAALRRGLTRRIAAHTPYLHVSCQRVGLPDGYLARVIELSERHGSPVPPCSDELPRCIPPASAAPLTISLRLDLDLDRLRLDLLRLRDRHRQHPVLIRRLAALGVDARRKLNLPAE